MKQLKDYLHLYLGCEVQIEPSNLKELMKGPTTKGILTIHLLYRWSMELHRLKPILRPLSDMTEEEWLQIEQLFVMPDAWGYYGIKDNFLIDEPQHRFSWKVVNDVLIELRRRSFDCDGLTEAGLAIDKTTLK